LAIEDAGDEKKIAVKSLLKSFVIAGVKVSAETDHTVPLLGQTEDLKVSLKSANLKLSREYRIWEKEIVGGVGSVHVVKSSSRLLIVQKSGDLLSLNVDDGKFLWIRPESLSSAKFAVAVELPERILLEDNHEDILQTGSRGVFEAFKSRWSDHLRSLFVGPSQAYSVPEALLKDKFGMHQLVVVGSANSGMVYAFDTQFKGKIVWQLDAKGSVKFIDILRGVESRQTPQIVVISEQQQDQQKKFLAYVVNALDGTVVKAAKEFSGDFLGAFHLNPLDHSVAVVNDKLEIKHFPEPSAAVNTKQDNYRTLVFAAKDQKSIEGYSLQLSDTVPLKLRWTFKLAVGEQLVVVGKRSRGDVASSIGRALGDRSVLYKYLNPNIMSVLTWDSVSSGEQMTTLHLTIIDSISGNVVMREKIPNVLMNKGKYFFMKVLIVFIYLQVNLPCMYVFRFDIGRPFRECCSSFVLEVYGTIQESRD
jgi:ER membrane protein complex subunit 1